MKTPFILLLDGMTGAGKTTTSKLLAEQIPRVAVIGMDKVKRFISDFERGERDNAIARNVVYSLAETYLSHGVSVLVEQSLKDDDLRKYEKLAQEKSVPLYKVQLFAEPELAKARVLARQKDWEHQVPEERLDRNIGLFERKESKGFHVIDTTDMTTADVVKDITSMLQGL